MLSSSFHSTAVQRSEERLRQVLDRKMVLRFPSTSISGDEWVMVILKGGTTCDVPVHLCVCAHALKCMWVCTLA